MYAVTAKNEEGREITCVLLAVRSRSKNGKNRLQPVSAFQDVETDELYLYDCDNDMFIKPKRMTLLGDCEKPSYLSLV